MTDKRPEVEEIVIPLGWCTIGCGGALIVLAACAAVAYRVFQWIVNF